MKDASYQNLLNFVGTFTKVYTVKDIILKIVYLLHYLCS